MSNPKVYLWTRDVKVVKMESGYVRPCDEGVFSGSLENVCTVLQSMMPSNDVDKLVSLAVETVIESLGRGLGRKEMESRLYTAIMQKSLNR